MLFHEIIEYNAIKTPDEIAFICEGHRQTWSEAEKLADKTADYLADKGVGKGDRISALSRNRLELLAIFAASSKLGAIYAPLNYRLTPPELNKILVDCQPAAIFVHDEFAGDPQIADLLRSKPAHVVQFDSFDGHQPLEKVCALAPPRSESIRGHEDDPLWICYTGGTTGEPKGVVLSHRNIASTAQNLTLINRIAPDDVYLMTGPMFYVTFLETIPYFLAGARTVFMNFNAGEALDTMQRERVTRLLATGTIFKLLIDEMSLRPREGLSLRNIDFGGAPFSAELALRAIDLFGCTIGQVYGQSESSVLTTYLPPEAYTEARENPENETAAARIRSVGKPAPTVLVGVMNEAGTLLPPGEIGEVVVKGDSVMLGYWNKKDLTDSTIRDGWLRTGDLGRMDTDGYVYLVDRIKDVIITGGENVYSSEVELALSMHPHIEEVAVIGKKDPHWGEAVHAIVVPKQGCETTPEELKKFCESRLAKYKTPRSFEFRLELPRLPTGKIAKHALRSPVITNPK